MLSNGTGVRHWRRQGVVAAASAALALSAGLASAAPALAAPVASQATAAAQPLAPPGLFTWGGEEYGQLGNGVVSPPGTQLEDAESGRRDICPARRGRFDRH